MPRQGSVVGPLREKYLSALRYQVKHVAVAAAVAVTPEDDHI